MGARNGILYSRRWEIESGLALSLRPAPRLHLKVESLRTRSETACRAEGLPEAGGRQSSFADSPANRGNGDNNRWCLWRPDHAGFDSRSIFEGALVEE
jgi:hypothetical protein